MEKTKKSKKEEDRETVFSDEVTKKKIEKHLRDINDTISEDDIMKVITDISSPDLNETNESNTANFPKEDLDNPDEEANQVPTTWNILD
ncbi:MAG: hypothetical protein M3Z92_09175 [Bacteroidota bacterium]|nr:hypothetical protein [Bacteroidota bacterium]MDQ6890273.1 hypothetical protein [Bacteroidota bacterium]